jgi:hypothetical protein
MLGARVFAVLLAMGVAACAGVGPGLTGNDTGGIIPWSPESAYYARAMAADHCGAHGKYARITSIDARPGQYIAFACHFGPRRAAF